MTIPAEKAPETEDQKIIQEWAAEGDNLEGQDAKDHNDALAEISSEEASNPEADMANADAVGRAATGGEVSKPGVMMDKNGNILSPSEQEEFENDPSTFK